MGRKGGGGGKGIEIREGDAECIYQRDRERLRDRQTDRQRGREVKRVRERDVGRGCGRNRHLLTDQQARLQYIKKRRFTA